MVWQSRPLISAVIYATVEAADRKGGIFRSNDRGGSWERRNEFDATAMYYARIVADPKNVDRVYIMNVFLMVSDDGGKTWEVNWIAIDTRVKGESDKAH